jgi:hypothetical protein
MIDWIKENQQGNPLTKDKFLEIVNTYLQVELKKKKKISIFFTYYIFFSGFSKMMFLSEQVNPFMKNLKNDILVL